MSETPNPGSREAIDLGCVCPVLDNNHGRQSPWGDGNWWVVLGCPVHAPEGPQEDKP